MVLRSVWLKFEYRNVKFKTEDVAKERDRSKTNPNYGLRVSAVDLHLRGEDDMDKLYRDSQWMDSFGDQMILNSYTINQ
jgi:hypothetical protein